jgi:hypothetical protein
MSEPAAKGGLREAVARDDVDDVIEEAARLQTEEADQLSVSDLKEVAKELDIDERYVDRATERLEARRAEATRIARERIAARRKLFRVTAGVLGAVLGVLLVTALVGQSGLRAELVVVEQARAQVRNVVERQQAVEARYRTLSESPEKDAELAGAENRVRIERKRYDEAVAQYNAAAGGAAATLGAWLFALPRRMPFSNEVTQW